jgi:TetR/AcrR family transcriptional regulator
LKGASVAQGRRREAIISAARAEFARYGFAGARIERIAESAGVNKQLLFHYFCSKGGLYSAAIASLFSSWQPVPEGEASPSDRLRQLTAHLLQWLSDNPGAARAIAESGGALEQAAEGAVPTADATRWLVDASRALRSAVEGGQRQGYFRDDVDPQAVAAIVTSSAVGHALTAAVGGVSSPAETARIVSNLTRAMVEYCAWR